MGTARGKVLEFSLETQTQISQPIHGKGHPVWVFWVGRPSPLGAWVSYQGTHWVGPHPGTSLQSGDPSLREEGSRLGDPFSPGVFYSTGARSSGVQRAGTTLPRRPNGARTAAHGARFCGSGPTGWRLVTLIPRGWNNMRSQD